ncbi:hypothetical protein HanHA300_Chr01g0011131 [Helianthus annuus]|nr:hypothetical protein HanHA300_Chr01g0011131 [Helianthus annuus]KAJ0626342.1 hypothetical protein HanHA89_Chr01g0012101 [Helianthus annuus]KAJ0782686.1 hypothetical protein HanLR1_Chr01g0011101 [Helianthus annuus]
MGRDGFFDVPNRERRFLVWDALEWVRVGFFFTVDRVRHPPAGTHGSLTCKNDVEKY